VTYLDTSYIVKCYLREPGSAEILAWLEGQTGLGCAALGRLEFHAAVRRHVSEGRLKGAEAERVFRRFEADCRADLWHWVPVADALIGRACERMRKLSPKVYLRTVDALHLTCASAIGCEAIYSHDRHMLIAAPHFGLEGRDILA